MNTQQLFDKVINHMRAQGKKGNLGERGWDYINPNNPCERCAKGVLMDLGVYEANKKKFVMTHICTIEESLNRELSNAEIDMLDGLESIFELSHPRDWEKHFEMAAKKFNLNYSLEKKPLYKEEKHHAAVAVNS